MNKKSKNYIDNYSNYISEGIKFANNSYFNKAEICFLKAIDCNKKKYEAYINLSNVYYVQKKTYDSYNILLEYLSHNKFNENIANQAAKILFNIKIKKDLLKLFKITNLKSPNYFIEKKYLYYVQGKYYEYEENHNLAIGSYLKSIKCDKYFFKSYHKLFDLYESTNRLEKLENLINDGSKIFYKIYNINIIKLYKSILLSRNNNFQNSQSTLHENNLSAFFAEDKNILLKIYGLQTRNFEKLGHYKEAFQANDKKNYIIKNLNENNKYEKNNILMTISKYKNFYNKDNVDFINNNLSYQKDSKLCFLVGFPRSGTTLLDTILRTHSKIKVVEEKPFLLDLRHEFFKSNNNDLTSILNINQKQKDYIRNNYYKKIISSKEDEAKIIIDKFPLSMIELGFIKCIFPSAKIIVALRHPCDVVTSCFFSSFKMNDAMVNFLTLDDTINFYNEVLNLFDFYNKHLELDQILIKYENIVNDFPNQVMLLLKFLGLNYEKKLEKFYITAKKREKISTPSYNQVINPLYASSIGRWSNYEKVRKSKSKLRKWINKFNY